MKTDTNHDSNRENQAAEQARLYQKLLQDTGFETDADALLMAMLALKQMPKPEVDALATQQLVEHLTAALPQIRTPTRAPWLTWLDNWWPWLLVRAQMRVVRREIWAASAVVMALGAVVTLLGAQPSPLPSSMPFTLLAPLVAAVGVAFLYGTDVEQALEIEQATPTSARLLLLVRLALVFGFDLVLGLVGSVLLVLWQADLSLWPLVSTWLAPMAFLSTLAFFLSIAFRDPLIGAVLAFGIWGLQTVHWFEAQNIESPEVFDLIPNLFNAEIQPYLWLLALVFGIAAIWLVGRDGRQMGELS